jgi:hypothetical protein
MWSFDVPSTVKHAIDAVPHTRENPFRHSQLLKSSHQLAELIQYGGMDLWSIKNRRNPGRSLRVPNTTSEPSCFTERLREDVHILSSHGASVHPFFVVRGYLIVDFEKDYVGSSPGLVSPFWSCVLVDSQYRPRSQMLMGISLPRWWDERHDSEIICGFSDLSSLDLLRLLPT